MVCGPLPTAVVAYIGKAATVRMGHVPGAALQIVESRRDTGKADEQSGPGQREKRSKDGPGQV